MSQFQFGNFENRRGGVSIFQKCPNFNFGILNRDACHRCGLKEDFKHACYWCPEALSLYTSTFQALLLTPKITIANILLGHQMPHYIGAHQMESEKFEIIDLISTMTLGHILKARSSGSELNPPGILISIKRHLRTIMGKMPKYKNVIIPILEFDPG